MKKNNDYLKINQNNAAILNRLKVLKYIIEKKTAKRIEISKSTGLQTSTLTYIIQDLKDLHLIREAALESREKGKGVKPNIITLNEDDNYVIGFDVREKGIRLAVNNLAGNVCYTGKHEISFHKNKITADIKKIYQQTLAHFKGKKVLGMTLGIPGIVDYHKQQIIASEDLKLQNYSLAQSLEEQLQLPVFIENNANLAAYYEYKTHYQGEAQNLFYLFLHLNGSKTVRDLGIGSGLIINQSIYRGDTFAAGEFGDVFKNLLYNVADEIKEQFLSSRVIELLDKYKKDREDRLVQALVSLFRNLGEIISNAVNIINPGIVVIGSDISFEEELLQLIKNGIKDKLVSFIRESIKINNSSFNDFDIAQGAALIAGENILSYEYFKELFTNTKSD